MHRLLSADNSTDLTFLVKIISGNKNIPIILTNDKGIIVSSINLDKPLADGEILTPELQKDFSKYPPINIFYNKKLLNRLYYKDSRLFAQLQNVMNNLVENFIGEVVANTASVPVIITDQSKTRIIAYGNLEETVVKDSSFHQQKIREMSNANKPIEISFGKSSKNYVFYEDSYFLKILKYYPIVLFVSLLAFLIIAYLAFATSRKYDQNQLWVGMSKETAHQLGTPISSLMAWVDILRNRNIDAETISEIEKDVQRLEMIADRFSKIGSLTPNINDDIVDVISNIVDYMKKRLSNKISISIISASQSVFLPLNRTLFEWVIENLCKNAVDSIGGSGFITIEIIDKTKEVIVDVSDNGKGIARTHFKAIFSPGFTTKKRGWGLGLTLVKRIIEDYHKGKIFVKQSEPDKKTTFRIILQKK